MSRRRLSRYSTASLPARALMAFAVVAGLCSAGCVQRRMTVRTNVPGAQVYVDNYEIGRTPVSTDFVYYGQRDIRLVKDGYETLKVKQSVNAPWYQLPGIDFLAENVWPWEIRDERNYNYQMQPQYLVPTETILSRAEELRSQNAVQMTAPVAEQPTVVPPGYEVPPGAATQPGVVPAPTYTVPGTPAQPTSPYAPQPSVGAPRL